MKNWFIGTAMVVGGGSIVIILLILIGVPHKIAAVVGMAIALVGFVIQLKAAFGMKNSFEQEMQSAQARNNAFIDSLKDLPTEEKIRKLLERSRQ